MADGFVEKDGGCGGNIERVGLAEHGDTDLEIGFIHPNIAESVLFGSDDNGGARSEIDGVVFKIRMGCGGEDVDIVGVEPGQRFFGGGFDDGDGEDRADTGADNIRIVDVRATVADDDGMNARGVGGAEDGAKVSRFLDGFGNDNERVCRETQIGEGSADLGPHGEESLRPVAIGHFLEDGFGAFKHLRACQAGTFD